MQEEDESSKKEREDKEQKDDEELARTLNDMDLSWEERKAKQMELAENGRRRQKDQEDFHCSLHQLTHVCHPKDVLY